MNIERPLTPVCRKIPTAESPPPLGSITPSTAPSSSVDDALREYFARLDISPPTPQADDPFTDTPWIPEGPSKWPVSHMPYIETAGRCWPSHISHLVKHVHYKGMAAKTMKILIYNAIQEAEEETKKRAIERLAYLRWPFNVSSSGQWKVESGMTKVEIEEWKRDMVENETWKKDMEGNGKQMQEKREQVKEHGVQRKGQPVTRT